jgi:tetratricopeptide (TPR) repeat protein
MEIRYKDLKKILDESIEKEYEPEGIGPMWHYVKRVAIGKFQLTDFLNACGDYCTYQESIKYYKASLLLDPQQKGVNAKLAKAYHATHNYKAALKCIDKAILIDLDLRITKNKILHLELKQTILIALKKFSKAMLVFEQIEALNPEKSSIAYLNRGIILKEMCMYERAVESLLKASEIDPANKDISIELLRIYSFHLQDKVLAKKYKSLVGSDYWDIA